MDAVLRQEREVLCLFACKSKHFLSINRLFLQQKVRAFRIQSSEVENLRAFFPFFPCFSAEPPLFRSVPPLRSRSVRQLHSLAPLAHACRHIRAYARARALRTQRLSVFCLHPFTLPPHFSIDQLIRCEDFDEFVFTVSSRAPLFRPHLDEMDRNHFVCKKNTTHLESRRTIQNAFVRDEHR